MALFSLEDVEKTHLQSYKSSIFKFILRISSYCSNKHQTISLYKSFIQEIRNEQFELNQKQHISAYFEGSLHFGELIYLKIGLFQLYFGINELILQLHDYPILDLLSLRRHTNFLLIDFLQQHLQSHQFILAFIDKLLIFMLPLQHFSQLYILLIYIIQLHFGRHYLSYIHLFNYDSIVSFLSSNLLLFYSSHAAAIYFFESWLIFRIINIMGLWRKFQLSIFNYLYKNRTQRLLKKRNQFLVSLCLGTFVTIIWLQNDYRIKRLISSNEAIYKPFSFSIDGPDPFKMTRQEWQLTQNFYMGFQER